MTVDESYTSKTSFLDKEHLHHFKNDKAKKDYVFLGKRIKRGLFKSQHNKVIHADINGALNIARKVIGENIYSLVNIGNIMASCALKIKVRLN